MADRVWVVSPDNEYPEETDKTEEEAAELSGLLLLHFPDVEWIYFLATKDEIYGDSDA